MARLALLLVLADIVLTAAALISCLSTEDEDIRALPRIAWVLIILFFSPVGAIAWFFAGRDRVAAPRRQVWRMGGGFPENERPKTTVAPDDDPDFLRKLDRDRAEQAAADDAERERDMLRKWEEEQDD
jgi:hypothetical protein